jgi:septum formation protein
VKQSPQSTFLLASASPRRRELLDQLGLNFRCQPVDVDETRRRGESPLDFVQRMALEKAQAGLAVSEGLPALGADTVVVVGDEVLGKPRDRADAVRMLGMLSGRTHDVYTAVALAAGHDVALRLSDSRVGFRILNQAELEAYVATGEPMDKAGAYAIQGLAAAFIDRLEGSYSGVMGLPLFETAQLLAAAGIPVI